MNFHNQNNKRALPVCILVLIFLGVILFSAAGCVPLIMHDDLKDSKPVEENQDESVVPRPGEGGGPGSAGGTGYLDDENAAPTYAEGGSSEDASGDLKPVGFINYGEFDAAVMPYTYIPLGGTSQVQPDYTSTVSSANDGVGDWPNTSRFLLLPEGTYTWCIDWEEGDLDEDGQIDYFHYIQGDPTILDEHDSDQTEFAEEVAISAPPSSGTIYEGRCEPAPIKIACTEYNSQVTVHTYLSSESNNPPDILVYTNVADQEPPPGIEISSGGNSTPWGYGMILWTEGDFTQATTSNPYSAFGGQIFGDHTIGWARVLFDGVEIWRGDASTYVIKEGAQFGVYVEVTCFPPGTHTMRIECLGIEGSGGGRSIPSGIFGFRE